MIQSLVSSRWRAFGAALVCSLGLALAGCGASQQSGGGEPKLANVKPGAMPEGSEWTGVFYNPIFGRLHLVKDGETISGCWRTKSGEKFGKLSGKVDGNLLRYEFTEYKIGQFDPNGQLKGRGYFVFKKSEGTDPDEIQGEYGYGDDEVGGGTWVAVNQRRRQPNCEEVVPSSTEAGTSEGWQ